MKSSEFDLMLHVHVVLEDNESTPQTVRFLVEEDLRDCGWDADVQICESANSK